MFTWRDGADIRRVWLQNDLVLQPTSENAPDDVVLHFGDEESIVARSARHNGQHVEPVFRSAGGILMTLPGGVVLILSESWDSARVSGLFEQQGIDSGRVEPMGFAPNAFLVGTEPGFASLALANSLAVIDGVEAAIPNWRSEMMLE